MKKVVVLIDGQNLYYTLKSMDLQERQIKWDILLHHLIDEQSDELIRTYWFRAAKLLDHYYTTENIKRDYVWKKYRTHAENFKQQNYDAIPEAVKNDVNQHCEIVGKWLKDAREKFNQLEYVYDKLSAEYEDIEIVKKGVVKINPYQQTYTGEKGVDIALAVKMIALSVGQQCDKIILVSGDYDYAEAINFVKNNMTKVHIVKLHKGIPPRSRNMSRDLSYLADKIIDLYEEDIRTQFLNKEADLE